ncbi:hypothetical protein BTR23_16350 [Alkalihalophilus pseudofirmus]|nr:hypothetical protein BTR23_16350 [Alkalihalophilus pseudofirmus]
MDKRNQDIREAIKKVGVSNWQVAELLGIHENTFYRLLRSQLTIEQRKNILNVIYKLEAKIHGKSHT